jgi:porphobilinogen synthase
MDWNMTLRRLRQNNQTRELVRETRLSHKQFIQPYFVVEGIKRPEPVPGLSGVYRETPDSLLKRIEADLEMGSNKILLFGVPAQKSSKKYDPDFTTTQIERVKIEFGPEVWVSVDVCLCSSTEHGHCGVLNEKKDQVVNSASVKELTKFALTYARSGADCVAPSDMMDGRIGSIREALNEGGFERTLLMSYSAKFHSRFYGPFRVAADSAPNKKNILKDRATYQIDPGSPKDALQCAVRDYEEGADILMVKPGLPYLDVISNLTREVPVPWAVYEVSGEYASIELMAEKGLMDGPRAHLECWTAFQRAGVQMIISYGSRHAKKWIEEFQE